MSHAVVDGEQTSDAGDPYKHVSFTWTIEYSLNSSIQYIGVKISDIKHYTTDISEKWCRLDVLTTTMECSYCKNQVDDEAEFFDVIHHKPWNDTHPSVVFCSYECIRGYLHDEHFQILFPDDETTARDDR